jgi:hypothetical protein
MNLITALEIQTNGDNIVCDVGGPAKNGKFCGWISLFRDGDLHKHLLSTHPIFATAKEATEYVEKIVTDVRAMDLTAK